MRFTSQPALRFAAAVLALAVHACAGDDAPSRPEDPASIWAPVGTIQGAVYDQFDQHPLPGAKVTINYGGRAVTATTGPDGTFSFPNVPATGNASGEFAATGKYLVVLDLTGVALAERTYAPFRTKEVLVGFSVIPPTPAGATADGEAASPDAPGTPIGYLVSSVAFPVRQTRATIMGSVLATQDLTPMRTTLKLVSLGGDESAFPAGATVARATSGEDGAFTFGGIEEGLEYRVLPTDGNYAFDTRVGFSYSGAPVMAAESGAVTKLPPIVLVERSPIDVEAPYVVAATPSEGAVLRKTETKPSVVITFSEAMQTGRPERAVASFRRMGVRLADDDPASLQAEVTFTAAWNDSATQLSITPTQPLTPGYRYRVTIDDTQLFDAAGNPRSRTIPGSQPPSPDALTATGSPVARSFAVSAEATDAVVADLVQEPDTADNQSPAVQVRALLVERGSTTDTSFTDAASQGLFTATNSAEAYVAWSAPAEPVLRYRVWVRLNEASNAALVSTAPINPYGITPAKTLPLAPTVGRFNISLADVARILAGSAPGVAAASLGNLFWDNDLSFDVGVSAINADGQEGTVVWRTLKDNTAPVLRTAGLGLNNAYAPGTPVNDTLGLVDNAGCANVPAQGSTPSARVLCPRVAVAHLGDRVATGFGQRTLLLEFSEPVDAASVTPSAVRLTSGTLPTQFAGQADPNSVAGTQEADATVLDVKPYDVQGGRTRYAAVTLDNFFGIDTGDALAFVPGGVRDVAGNALRDAALATATFVDQTPPMIKRVALQADETISVVFTKFVHVTPPTGSSTGDMEPSLFGFSNVDAARLGLSSVALITLPAAREQMATLTVTDASWLRGYNSGLPNCSRGSRVVLQGVRNADHNSTAGGPGVAGTDDGTQAYVNVVPDPADPANSPGAYALNNSPMGVRSSFADTLGPRLSRFAADTSLATSANRVSVPPNGNSSDLRLTVVLTELTRSFVDGTDPASAANAANWRVAITDLGLDNDWTGNGPNDPSPTQATAEVVGVRFTGNASAPCGSETSRYELTVRVRNDSASSKVFGARSIALSRNVTDAAGNVVTLHNGWVYDPARPGQPGWVRDSL